MATPIQRTKALLESLTDGTLTDAKMKQIAEAYTGLIGSGAATSTIAQAFLAKLGKHIRATARREAYQQKRNELATQAKQAANDAEDLLPPEIPSQ
jgi:Pyruvate/2-oxoacid:ferredoxin oxidoreductase gamma subunit